MPDPTEPAVTEPAGTVPALPTHAIAVPLVPPAVRTRANRASRRAGGRRPLPDAQAIYSFTIPEVAPPYDDSVPGRREAPGTGRGDLTSVTATRAPARGDRLARAPVPQPPMQAPGTQPPETAAWPSRFAQVLTETLAGSRPADQIVPWTTEQARRRISQLGPMLATAHRPRIRRVIVSSPASGVLEMTVIVGLGADVRAVAVRLERPSARPPSGPSVRGTRSIPAGSGEWLCTAIEAA